MMCLGLEIRDGVAVGISQRIGQHPIIGHAFNGIQEAIGPNWVTGIDQAIAIAV